jgi:hypothetical protein
MSYRLEFSIAGLPRMTNPSGRANHWAIKAAEARKWHAFVFVAVASHRPVKPLEHARLTLTRYSSVSPDSDGLVSGFKHVIDGLVKAGVLVNDKVSNIGMPTYKWEKSPPRKGAIRVLVEEA